MKTSIYSSVPLGDMLAVYLTDGDGHITLTLIPAGMEEDAAYNMDGCAPLVPLYLRGDRLPGGFANGLSMTGNGTEDGMRLESQTVTEAGGETTVTTILSDPRGCRALHRLVYRAGLRALESKGRFENGSATAVVLENLSSFSLGCLTPFGGGRETDRMKIHRARSFWSAEGRIRTETVETMHLEPSWAGVGVRMEKFGQNGSMPVRGWFPFAAAEDEAAGVTWAAQLACPYSWQIEIRRQRASLSLVGGGADYDSGHWQKTVSPGEACDAPSAYLTVGKGGLDPVSQRLLDLHTESESLTGEGLPLVFNEYCTTWGNPNEDNIRRIVEIMKPRRPDFFVIDAGWYGKGNWSFIGDWTVNEAMFPHGFKNTVKTIADAGMKPGIWFEAENCSPGTEAASHTGWLLKRHGTPICTGGRMFLNMASPDVRDHLRQSVIGLLRDYGFRYVKIDYNDSIGLGCDDPDGLGEGLRKTVAGTQDFWRELHREIPGLMIENCSSGGHRLEPSMMNLADMASFSDAHECVHIPIIAARLHRLIRPSKSQIWAVLRKTDSLRRIHYSLVNTLLGVMCLSGDVYDLSPAQWAVVDRAIAFYRCASPVIRRGTSSFYGPEPESWEHPEGWQAVVRAGDDGRVLVTVHTFGGEIPGKIALPMPRSSLRILDALTSEENRISLTPDGRTLEVELKANFEASAILLGE